MSRPQKDLEATTLQYRAGYARGLHNGIAMLFARTTSGTQAPADRGNDQDLMENYLGEIEGLERAAAIVKRLWPRFEQDEAD